MASKARNIADLLNASGKVTADDLDVGQIGGRRNLIINGDMQVAQRGTSFAGLTASNYIADRWRLNQNVGNSALADSSIVTGPTAGTKAIEVTVATAATALGTNSYCSLNNATEGQDTTPVTGFGSSNAKELTLSFWHKHSIAGTYCMILRSSNSSLNLLLEYEQTSADVWEKAVLTVPPAITGTFYADTQRGLNVEFTLTNGTAYQSSTTDEWFSGTYYHSTPNQTQMFLTSGAKFRITQVQLELGSVATPFEHRSYGEELALCQRYYQKRAHGIYLGGTSNDKYFTASIIPQMRATPSATVTGTVVSGNDSGTTVNPVSSTSLYLYKNGTYSVGAAYNLDAEL